LKFLLSAAPLRLDRVDHLCCPGVASAGGRQVWTILGRHQTVALNALGLHGLQLLSAEVEVGLVEGSLLHLAAGGDGGGAVVQGGEGFLGRVWDTLVLGLAAALVRPQGSLQVRGGILEVFLLLPFVGHQSAEALDPFLLTQKVANLVSFKVHDQTNVSQAGTVVRPGLSGRTFFSFLSYLTIPSRRCGFFFPGLLSSFSFVQS